jgi:universal stress protein A
MPTRKILFCTDFSENSEAAGDRALEYCHAFGADLEIIHVIETWKGFPADEGGVHVDVMDAYQRMEETSKAKLHALVEEFGRECTGINTYCRTGIPADEIVRVAREEAADLIVMGTHGWTGIRHLLVGSVAENVVRRAHCPVLVVRPPASEDG